MDTIYHIIQYEEKPNGTYSKLIHDDFMKMTKEEKENYLHFCMTSKDIDKVLLKVDLDNYSREKKIMTKYEFIGEVKKLLNHYLILQKDLFEDTKWTLYEPGNDTYELQLNEFIMENTIPLTDCYNQNIIHFMEQIKRQGNEMSNFEVNYKILSDKEYNICRTIFIIQF